LFCSFCLFFFRWACYGEGFLGKLVFCLLLPFAASGFCKKRRKSKKKVDFRRNVISAASSEGSSSNLSAFLCFWQCSLVKNSLRVCGSVCLEAASLPPFWRSFPGWSSLQFLRSSFWDRLAVRSCLAKPWTPTVRSALPGRRWIAVCKMLFYFAGTLFVPPLAAKTILFVTFSRSVVVSLAGLGLLWWRLRSRLHGFLFALCQQLAALQTLKL
jgi:hypothetical protein